MRCGALNVSLGSNAPSHSKELVMNERPLQPRSLKCYRTVMLRDNSVMSVHASKDLKLRS